MERRSETVDVKWKNVHWRKEKGHGRRKPEEKWSKRENWKGKIVNKRE